MCGRYTLFSDEEIEEIKEIVREAEENSKMHVQTGEIYPTNIAPVLLKENSRLTAFAMSWGFPRFDGKGVVFNARSETVADKPMFRKSLFERRCLIPSTGFYEWKPEGTKKIKYQFNLPDTPLLYMAGIYNHYKDAPEGKQDCFTILTTDANVWMKDTHNRMPVVLLSDEYNKWLQDALDLPALFNRQNVALVKQESG